MHRTRRSVGGRENAKARAPPVAAAEPRADVPLGAVSVPADAHDAGRGVEQAEALLVELTCLDHLGDDRANGGFVKKMIFWQTVLDLLVGHILAELVFIDLEGRTCFDRLRVRYDEAAEVAPHVQARTCFVVCVGVAALGDCDRTLRAADERKHALYRRFAFHGGCSLLFRGAVLRPKHESHQL